MKLVYEDEYGAYLGVLPEFLEKFRLMEQNPNFEVYDSLDGRNRFITVKSSRMPDDEDIEKGKYGIDFNRQKPDLQQALQYRDELPEGYQWINGVAFAAGDEEEYEQKSRTWDNFYSYIWGTTPQTVWVAPHSGSVNRPPDDLLRFPKLLTDNATGGVAALCAYKGKSKPTKRLMMAVHSTGHLAAVLNLGDFGILDQEKLDVVASKMERKYRARAQVLAEAFKRDFSKKTIPILKSMREKQGTLAPAELDTISYDDSLTVRYYEKGLKLYGQEIKEYTLEEFERAITDMGKIQVPVVSSNFIYTGRNVGKRLRLSEKIDEGLLESALVIEGARLYMARDPNLVSEILLDIRDELFY